jgi:hypothetical protein
VKRRGAVLALLGAMAAYVAAATVSLVRASAPNLLHACLFPNSYYSERTIWPIPWGHQVVLAYIDRMNTNAFRDRFVERFQVNAFVVFSEATTSKRMTVASVSRAVALADVLRRRGIPLDAFDASGCTSMHRAIVDDVPVLLEYLRSRGAPQVAVGNPEAGVAVCRSTVESR